MRRRLYAGRSATLARRRSATRPRPLACRVYYCDPNYQETGNRISEKYLRRLKDLADREGTAWRNDLAEKALAALGDADTKGATWQKATVTLTEGGK